MLKAFLSTAPLLCALASFSSFAAQKETISTVTDLYIFPLVNHGDMTVKMATPAAGCTAFWMSPTDDGFKTIYSLLLAAYTSQTPVRISGDDSSGARWSGSGDWYCHLSFVGGVSSL